MGQSKKQAFTSILEQVATLVKKCWGCVVSGLVKVIRGGNWVLIVSSIVSVRPENNVNET